MLNFYIVSISINGVLTADTRRRMRNTVFIFKKFQGASILIFLVKHEASFYTKEQTQNKIWNLIF